jgi:hypothetical protein
MGRAFNRLRLNYGLNMGVPHAPPISSVLIVLIFSTSRTPGKTPPNFDLAAEK